MTSTHGHPGRGVQTDGGGAFHPRVTSVAHPSEGGSAAAAAAAPTLTRPSLATLLTGHILQDGEVVLLILRPSLWFILLSSLRFVGAVLLIVFAGLTWDEMARSRYYVNAAVLLGVARLMWAVLSWASRIYVLTDLRIIRLAGVFTVDVFGCPLRKVARVRQVTPLKERLLAVGTLEITPLDEDLPVARWETIARPAEIHKEVISAIRRAKHNGGG